MLCEFVELVSIQFIEIAPLPYILEAVDVALCCCSNSCFCVQVKLTEQPSSITAKVCSIVENVFKLLAPSRMNCNCHLVHA